MLPHFPNAYKEMRELFNAQMFDAMHTAAPMLLQIPVRPQREGRESSFQDEGGKVRVIDFQRQTAAVEIKTENARGMTLEEFVSAARKPGTELGTKIALDIYSTIGAATEEVGNVINARGGPFTFDLLLACIEKVQLDFLPDGRPRFPELHLGAAAYTDVQRQLPEWNRDPECRKRFEEVLRRKREEFLERETRRRLAD
ncbi:MAG: hypothetical protein ACREFF_05340 [Candidatus Udaeobacter sp.]